MTIALDPQSLIQGKARTDFWTARLRISEQMKDLHAATRICFAAQKIAGIVYLPQLKF
jgi:hypothetical protein